MWHYILFLIILNHLLSLIRGLINQARFRRIMLGVRQLLLIIPYNRQLQLTFLIIPRSSIRVKAPQAMRRGRVPRRRLHHPELLKVRVPQSLLRRDPVLSLVNQQPLHQIPGFVRHMLRQHHVNATSFNRPEINLNAFCLAFKITQHLNRGSSKHLMNQVNLVQLIFSRKQRIGRQQLVKNTADPPKVHFGPIVPVSQEALWRSVPSGAYVLSVRVLAVDSSAGAEIR